LNKKPAAGYNTSSIGKANLNQTFIPSGSDEPKIQPFSIYLFHHPPFHLNLSSEQIFRNTFFTFLPSSAVNFINILPAAFVPVGLRQSY
jgi:hypothetical protein